jgi:soluble lytic murein transglycosylase-like protein
MKRRSTLRIAALLLLCAASVAGQHSAEPFAASRERLLRAAEEQMLLLRAEGRPGPATNETRVAESNTISEKQPLTARDSQHAAVRETAERLERLGVDGVRIFREERVPLEYLAVALVESGVHPLAVSPKGARGPWQFMPETARRMGLRVDEQLDERTHPERSTRAAARYLRQLYARFADWDLALAAYNAGEARVEAALQKGDSRDFSRLAELGLLPEETRRYVPAVTGRTPRGRAVAGQR